MPSFDVDDTIAAIASAPGSAVRGIVRISGPECQTCLEKSFETETPVDWASFKSPTSIPVTLPLNHPSQSHQPGLEQLGWEQPGVDQLVSGRSASHQTSALPGKLLFWPTRSSYTRQPSAEFHTIGSPSLLKLALTQICQSGARLANPGEFTLRAFLSGRLDLTQAEAVLGIIDANSQSDLQHALNQLAGGLSEPLTRARDLLTFVLAELEAGLDFVEEDIEFISQQALVSRLQEAKEAVEKVAAQITSRDSDSETIRVALVGLPNAGKSSLFNCLLGDDRAIVTNIAGTTTDFLTANLELPNLSVQLIDTAGQEERISSTYLANDAAADASIPISDQAQDQRETVESHADITLLCIDLSCPLSQWEIDQIAQIQGKVEQDLPIENPTIIIGTKSDLAIYAENQSLITDWAAQNSSVHFVATSVSNKTSGITELKTAIAESSARSEGGSGEIVNSTVVRTANCLTSAQRSIESALQVAIEQAGEEIVAAEIRQALDDLGLVVGTVYTDDILDVVFSRFCIGK